MNSKLNDFYSEIDENKIWNEILSRIDSEDKTEPDRDIFEYEKITVKRRPVKYISMISAAAAVILMIFSVSSNFTNETADISDSLAGEQISEIYEEEAVGDADDNAVSSEDIFFPAETGWNYSYVSVSEAKSYCYSDFSSVTSPYYEDNYSDDFFVEAEVLENTDFFLDCTVDSAEYDSLTETVVYTVSPIHVICPESITLPQELEIKSGRAYVLGEEKEYLLPIVQNSDGEYFIADPSSPQIELTEEGYVLFQNGWKSLMDGDEQYLQKDSSSPDDFFYDRMNITVESKLQNLFDNFLNQ